MFEIRKIEEEIEKLKDQKMTWDTTMKLAHLYIVLENLKKEEFGSDMVEGYGEFRGRMNGRSRIGFKSEYEQQGERRSYENDYEPSMHHGQRRNGREMNSGYASSRASGNDECEEMMEELSRGQLYDLMCWTLKRLKTQNPREYRAIMDAVKEIARQ